MTAVKVIIPMKSFISSWSSGEGGSLDWLLENVGQSKIDWEADVCKDLVDHAEFWFKREEDALAFKLRWLD